MNSIVTSESVGGKVDVWSQEGAGTEIKVTFLAERIDDDEGTSYEAETFRADDMVKLPTISLVGFDTANEGVKLLNRVIRVYITSWWGFEIDEGPGYGGIVILNDDPRPVQEATERRDTSRPFIILSAARGNSVIMAIANDYERIGGFCRILFKPGGPSRLRAILKLCLHAFKIGSSRSRATSPQRKGSVDETQPRSVDEKERSVSGGGIPRRNSDESHSWTRRYPQRPPMMMRASTAHPASTALRTLSSTSERGETPDPDTVAPTIAIGSGGSLLKSSIGTIDTAERRFRVLVVEDNSILRNLL